MKLYHYATENYDALRSMRAQGKCSKDEIRKAEAYCKEYFTPGPYIDSISLFFDPVPLELLPKIYVKDHHTWFKGNKLFEFEVESDRLEMDINFNVTETPDDLKEVDRIDWDRWNNDEEFVIEYFQRKRDRKLRSGEAGKSVVKLNRQIQHYKGTTEKFYLAASKRADFKDHQGKYAACVPHLMLYPKHGVINIDSVQKVVVGSNDHLALENAASPKYHNWQ